MSPAAATGGRAPLRFALPATLGPDAARRAARLEAYLTGALGKQAQVSVPVSYQVLARELLAGKVDAAWAPPFVCARIEAMGVRVLVRGVRHGASTYRAALLCRAQGNVTLETLEGTAAAWADKDSVGGYLLAAAYLRERGMDPAKLFYRQDFPGSYRAALEAVRGGQADVSSVFAPPARAGLGQATGLLEVWPEAAADFRVLAFTDESPNDGVAVAMSAPAALVEALEHVLLALHHAPGEASQVLADCFKAERFEPAPRLGYRALYRVALASL